MSARVSENWWDGHLLTVAEVATRLRVSRMTVYRMVKSGDLRAVEVLRSIRIPERVLDQYLAASVVVPEEEP